MSQQQSPWLEAAYGWTYGENGWNVGMDSNLLKFSVMFDRNVDSIAGSLPAAVNGQVHYNTSDNRIYFAVSSTYFSTPVPKWFTVIERSTGNTWQFNGSTLVQVEKLTSVVNRLAAVEVILESLGTAAFEDISAFATQAALDVVAGQSQSYTDNQINSTLDNLSATTGAGLIGYGSGETYSIGTIGEAIQDLSTQMASQGVYVGLSPTSTLSMTATDAEVFGVSLTEPVTTLTLLGGDVGEVATINVIFSQDSTGHVVTVPANVILADGVTEIASSSAGDISLVTFTKVNGVDLWYHELRKVYSTVIPPVAALPAIADENSTFNDEGTATTGWTPSNATLSVISSSLRQTKTAAGTNSSMSKTLTFTPSNSDYILYGKVKAKYNTDDAAVVWLLDGSKEVSIWFGSANGGNSLALGSISIVGTTGPSTRNIAAVASGYNYETTAVEFALQYDHKFSTLTCWFREGDGRWKWKARVACNWFSSTQIQALTTTGSAAGAWIEFDYLTLARPNIALLSDSIGEGKTLFSPDPTLALTDDESTWMRHAPIYQTLRNNLVVNKGVGGNSSTQMLSRVTDVTNTGARVVFLHASSNDETLAVSQATRTSNIQSTVNAITAASGQTVLLNAMYGTAAGPDNTPSPDLRDYMRTWWTASKSTITGLALDIDIMQPIDVAGDFMDAALTQADGIHPNISGHTAVGSYITTFD